MSHSLFIFVKFTLITDSIAVALNDCAKDCLHKDYCMQAFSRNTLSKPHNWLPQRGTALSLWHPYSIHDISSDLQGQHLSLPPRKRNNPYLTCVLHHSLGSCFSSYFQINFKISKNLWKWYYRSSIQYFGPLNSTSCQSLPMNPIHTCQLSHTLDQIKKIFLCTF